MTDRLNPTAAVRPGEELDWQRLDACLKDAIDGLRGDPRISQYPTGNSNLTYRLEYPGHDLVVRRPPFGTKARSAHNMQREYRVMQALRPVYPAVPETLFYTDDAAVIGAEFYVMRRVEGQVIGREIPRRWGFSEADNRRLCLAFWDKLVELHRVDFAAAGLGDFGRPAGYAERQVKGWNERFRRARTPDVDELEDVQQWLEERTPADPPAAALLHGDFRLDNVVLDSHDPGRVVAVLDWEICALGDPLMDLGNALAYWIEPGDPEFLRGLQLQPSTSAGMLARREIIDRYAAGMGWNLPEFTYYYLYGLFRNTTIIQQIYYRYYHGETRDTRFASFGELVRRLGQYCREIIHENIIIF